MAGLEHLLAVTEGASDARARAFLQQTGYQSRAEVGEYLAKHEATLRRLRGEEVTPTKDDEDPADMVFPLLEVRRTRRLPERDTVVPSAASAFARNGPFAAMFMRRL